MKFFNFFKTSPSVVQKSTNIDQFIELVFRESLEKSQLPASVLVCDLNNAYFDSHNNYQQVMSGASEVLGVFAHANTRRRDSELKATQEQRFVHFISLHQPSSRAAIEDRLILDGYHWSSCTYKKQAYSSFFGKSVQAKDNFEFKLAAILNLLSISPQESTFTFWGGSEEFDLYLYAGVWLFLKKFLSTKNTLEYFEMVESRELSLNEAYLNAIAEKNHCVKFIFTRASQPSSNRPEIAATLQSFEDYLDIALHFLADGIIQNDELWYLIRTFHNIYGFSRKAISAKLSLFFNSNSANKISDKLKADLIQNKFIKENIETSLNTASSINPYNKLDYSTFESSKESCYVLNQARDWVKTLINTK